jgi:cbb3-type cytochrome c oxidase subunit III
MYLRNNPTQTRRSLALVFSIFILAVMWLTNHAEAQEQGRPRSAEAQKLKNPLPSDAESVEAGKKLYQRHCASCHGAGAKGDGGMSLSGGTPSDLTDETWDYGSTDGEIFVAIRDGVSADMLAYKEKLNEKQIWQVVTFLRSLGPKPSK